MPSQLNRVSPWPASPFAVVAELAARRELRSARRATSDAQRGADLRPAFTGLKNIYVYAASNNGTNPGWVSEGIWTGSKCWIADSFDSSKFERRGLCAGPKGEYCIAFGNRVEATLSVVAAIDTAELRFARKK
jgi:hypothetical protein